MPNLEVEFERIGSFHFSNPDEADVDLARVIALRVGVCGIDVLGWAREATLYLASRAASVSTHCVPVVAGLSIIQLIVSADNRTLGVTVRRRVSSVAGETDGIVRTVAGITVGYLARLGNAEESIRVD